MTRFQLRGGRAILGINRKDLASLANIDQYVITRAERLDNKEYIRPKDSSLPNTIKNIFKQHGISFPSPFTISIKNSWRICAFYATISIVNKKGAKLPKIPNTTKKIFFY